MKLRDILPITIKWRSDERYQLLFDNNPLPMWVYECRSLRFVAVNDAALKLYGYSRSQFLSMTLLDIQPYEDVPQMLRDILTPSDDLRKSSIRRQRCKSGEILYVEVADSPLPFQGKSCVLSLANDVTLRMRSEAALRNSERKYRDLVDNARMGIYRADHHGSLLEVNPALVQMLGYLSPQELMERNLNRDIYVHGADREAILQKVEVHTHLDSEVDWKRKNGDVITVRLFGHAVPDQGSEGGVRYDVIVEEVTRQRQMERQLRQAQKMEAVGQLASGVAHDFNNLLMVITSSAEMLRESLSDASKVSRNADRIIQAGKKAATLTSQLLAFSRKQPQQLELLDMNLITTEFCKFLPKLVGEHIRFSVIPNPIECHIYADRGQVEQVIMNLVINARDAMPNGGHLIVGVHVAELDTLYAQGHRAEVPPGKYVLLTVSDTGCGIDEKTQAKIFEPFFTTKEQGKGTGLGLATVYGIVKQNKGFVWVYSEVGIGTTFKVYLPQVEQGPSDDADSSKEHQHVHGAETILLVEDEEGLRASIAEYLSCLGYQVLVSQDGMAAIQVAQQFQGQIHLLLSDVVLPKISGLDAATEIQQLHPEARVVFMSGYSKAFIEDRRLRDATVLQKPVAMRVLGKRIQEALIKTDSA